MSAPEKQPDQDPVQPWGPQKKPDIRQRVNNDADAFDAMWQENRNKALFLLWLTLAGLWQTGETIWAVLRTLARIIA